MIKRTAALYSSECSKRPSSKDAASEGARRTLRYVEPLSDATCLREALRRRQGTPLEDFFSILLDRAIRHERPLYQFAVTLSALGYRCAPLLENRQAGTRADPIRAGLEHRERRPPIPDPA